MKLVKQKHECGCVPACLSMLTEISYEKCLKLFYPTRKDKRWETLGVHDDVILGTLIKLNIKHKLIYGSEPLSKLEGNAILAVSHPAYGPEEDRGHVVVWDFEKQKVLDPYPDKNRELKRSLKKETYEKSIEYIIKILS